MNSWYSCFVNIYIHRAYSLLQEPFKSVPLIWTIHETALALRSRSYTLDWQIQLANHWKGAFNRATVVVFPNYYFPVNMCLFN